MECEEGFLYSQYFETYVNRTTIVMCTFIVIDTNLCDFPKKTVDSFLFVINRILVWK